MKRFTKNTIVSPAKVKADLELIRSRGYSMTEGEWQEGVLGFAMAIKNPGGEIAAATTTGTPRNRKGASAKREKKTR